jgi:hypothetical protein
MLGSAAIDRGPKKPPSGKSPGQAQIAARNAAADILAIQPLPVQQQLATNNKRALEH